MSDTTQTTRTLGERMELTREDMFRDYSDVGTLKEWLYDWHGANEWLFLKINGIRGEFYDQLMLNVTQLGNYKNFFFWLLAIGLVAALSLMIRNFLGKGGVKAHAAMWFGVLVVLLVGFAVNGLFVRTVKDHFNYPRPYVALENQEVHRLQAQDPDDALRSFPSGHSSFITFLMISLWPVFRENMRWLLFVPIAAVAWSRVSLGVHFPADVLWAFVMTGALIIMVRKICYALLFRLFRLSC
jgi:membrane-associated phospholipid phosphatase